MIWNPRVKLQEEDTIEKKKERKTTTNNNQSKRGDNSKKLFFNTIEEIQASSPQRGGRVREARRGIQRSLPFHSSSRKKKFVQKVLLAERAATYSDSLASLSPGGSPRLASLQRDSAIRYKAAKTPSIIYIHYPFPALSSRRRGEPT